MSFLFHYLSLLLITSNPYVYYNDVDNPSTIDDITTHIFANDDVDGDISDNIYIINDDYTSHSTQIGEYIITFGVIDSFNQETTFDLLIINVDITKPTYVPNKIELTQHTLLSEFNPNILFIDSYDGIIQNYNCDTSTISISQIGTYKMNCNASDVSGNVVYEQVNVDIVKTYSVIHKNIYIQKNLNISNDELVSILSIPINSVVRTYQDDTIQNYIYTNDNEIITTLSKTITTEDLLYVINKLNNTHFTSLTMIESTYTNAPGSYYSAVSIDNKIFYIPITVLNQNELITQTSQNNPLTKEIMLQFINNNIYLILSVSYLSSFIIYKVKTKK